MLTKFILMPCLFVILLHSKGEAQISFSSVADAPVEDAVHNGRYQKRNSSAKTISKRTPSSTGSTASENEILEESIKLKKNKGGKTTDGKSIANTDVDKAVANVQTDAGSVGKDQSLKAEEQKAELQKTEIQTDSGIDSKAEQKNGAAEELKAMPNEPTISEQVKMLANGEGEKLAHFYQEQVHPDDIRNNQMEIDLIPFLSYNDSRSIYSYRNYQSFFNGVQFGGRLWLTPAIGIEGRTDFSLGADLPGDATNRTPAKYENFYLSFSSRKFFGLSRRSASTETALTYSERNLTVSADSTRRLKLKSSGLGISFKLRVPSSANYASVYSVSFWPKQYHSEGRASGSSGSGDNSENHRLEFGYTGEFKMNRESQVLLSLGLAVERNVFTGAALASDPETNTTPNNVSVTNTFVLMGIGYRWGR